MEADIQSFVLCRSVDDCTDTNENNRRDSAFSDTSRHRDSGIDSTQASPSPNTITSLPLHRSSTPSLTNENTRRRPSSALLHPDHARLLPLQKVYQTSSNQSSAEDLSDCSTNCDLKNPNAEPAHSFYLHSPSTTSSMTSITGLSKSNRYVFLFSLKRGCESEWKFVWCFSGVQIDWNLFFCGIFNSICSYCDTWRSDKDGPDRRRSTAARCSLFDALDLECALLRAATRGSVGPYSLSESLHKLTFTQSLAFPALARGLANKRMARPHSTRPSHTHESLLNTFAKVITALVLFVVSILVFLIVYKFVKTWGLLLTQHDGLLAINNNSNSININSNSTSSMGYFNFYPPTSNVKSMATVFDWPESISQHSVNVTDAFPVRFNAIRNAYNNYTVVRRRSFSVRHFKSRINEVKRPLYTNGQQLPIA